MVAPALDQVPDPGAAHRRQLHPARRRADASPLCSAASCACAMRRPDLNAGLDGVSRALAAENLWRTQRSGVGAALIDEARRGGLPFAGSAGGGARPDRRGRGGVRLRGGGGARPAIVARGHQRRRPDRRLRGGAAEGGTSNRRRSTRWWTGSPTLPAEAAGLRWRRGSTERSAAGWRRLRCRQVGITGPSSGRAQPLSNGFYEVRRDSRIGVPGRSKPRAGRSPGSACSFSAGR